MVLLRRMSGESTKEYPLPEHVLNHETCRLLIASSKYLVIDTV